MREIVGRLGRRTFYGWRIVVALGVTTIISYGTSQYLIALLIDPLAHEFGWDGTSIGAAYSGTLLVSGLLGLVFGRLVDRLGARFLMSSGSVISGVSLLLLARVRTLPEFDALWTVGMGLGAALTYYPVSFTVVANWFEGRRTDALSMLTFMGAFSSTIFYPSSGWLIGALGWRHALMILAGIQLLVALPLHLAIVRRHPEDHGLHPDGASARSTSTPQSGVPFHLAVRSAAFWLLTSAISLSYFTSTIVLLEHVTYLISRGYAPTLAATLVGLFGIAYLPGRFIVAYASKTVPLAFLFAGAFALEGFGIALLLLARDALWVAGYVFAFGAAYGAIAPLRGAIMAQRFGRRSYGAIFAAQGVPVGILSALGPVVAGRIIDTLGFAPAFVSCIAALVVAAVIILVPTRAIAVT